MGSMVKEEDKGAVTMVGDIEVPDDLEPAKVNLLGMNGGAGTVMSYVSNGLKEAGNETWMIDLFREQCFDGDYNHLLRTAMAFCENDGAGEED